MKALEDVIDDRVGLSQRPLAFIISGPNSEFHEGLHDRLVKYPLPRWLLGATSSTNRVRPADLPTEPERDASATARGILRPIELALDVKKWGNDALPAGLTYFRAMIPARSKLDRRQAEVLEKLLGMLSDSAAFPDLPAGKALCIGISIAWESNGPTQKTLENRFPEDRYPNLRFRVLPNLGSPHRDDAQRWVDLVATLKRDGLTLPASLALIQRVHGAFGESATMPMRDLYYRLAA